MTLRKCPGVANANDENVATVDRGAEICNRDALDGGVRVRGLTITSARSAVTVGAGSRSRERLHTSGVQRFDPRCED